MNYYNQIKERLVDIETTIRVKDYTKNRVMIENYFEIGKLIVEAQGGLERNKYGNQLIKDYANKLTKDFGKGYSWRNLYNMRSYYIMFSCNEILQPLVAKLNWTHILILMRLKNIDEIIYYANRCISNSLSKRELEGSIKLKEYERLPEDTKEKLKNKQELKLKETITDPIIIPNPKNIEILEEKKLQKLIMENIYLFLRRLGSNYMFVGNEYPIKIETKYYRMDILLFNMEYDAYVVIELKIGELKKEYIGQVELYMNYVDKNIKKINHNRTIGIILCKRNNKILIEYCSNPNIITREYVLM